MQIQLICLDADDTLWHNMRHFAEAEVSFAAMLQPFADAKIARARLEACETRNLKHYGYGAKGFTLSMIETALEIGGPDLPVSVVQNILKAGWRLLAHPVESLSGIEETLHALADRGRLALVTKGDLLHQEAS
jgi:putative hydrolase of the HAD superfamily